MNIDLDSDLIELVSIICSLFDLWGNNCWKAAMLLPLLDIYIHIYFNGLSFYQTFPLTYLKGNI